jgi:hypothetical protein
MSRPGKKRKYAAYLELCYCNSYSMQIICITIIIHVRLFTYYHMYNLYLILLCNWAITHILLMSLQASTLTFVRLSATSENWHRTSTSCITVVRRDKWKNQRVTVTELQISCVFAFFTLWKRVKTHVLSDQSVHITHTYCCVSKLSKFGAYLYR